MGFLIALLAAALFAGGAALGKSNQSQITKTQQNHMVDYLSGNTDSTNLFNGGSGANTASQVFGYGAPAWLGGGALAGTGGIIGSGIAEGIRTGDVGTGIKTGLANALTMGWYGLANAINQAQEAKKWQNITNNINRDDFSGFTNNELEALLDYYTDEKGAWFWKHDSIDDAAFLRDYQDYLKWREEVGDMPAEVDWDTVYNNADFAINQEDAAVQAIYDNGLTRSSEMLNRALDENRAAYLDYRNQLLTNDAMNRQALAGSTRYELDRQQRNAITRGASAAQRLVTNINTQLGLQASSAQQALNTSNALAQQLLNYRNAQTGIRSEYNTALTNYDNQRANLIRGAYERKRNARLGAASEAQMRHDQAMEQWEKRLNSWASDSPWADFYRNSQYRNGTGKKSTYSL